MEIGYNRWSEEGESCALLGSDQEGVCKYLENYFFML